MRKTASLAMISAIIVIAVACDFFKTKEAPTSKIDSTVIDTTVTLPQDTLAGVIQNDSVLVSK